jgi:hypothetical protein
VIELKVDREAESHGLQQRGHNEHEHDASVTHRLDWAWLARAKL